MKFVWLWAFLVSDVNHSQLPKILSQFIHSYSGWGMCARAIWPGFSHLGIRIVELFYFGHCPCISLEAEDYVSGPKLEVSFGVFEPIGSQMPATRNSPFCF